MQKIFLILVLFTLPLGLYAQDSRCGTFMTESDYTLFSSIRNMDGERSSERFYIPIAYHCIARTNGTGVYRLRDLLTSHCELNEAFDSLGFTFYIHSIDTIANTNYYEFSSYSVGNTIKSQNNVPAVCNVYLNNDPNGVCGYATFPGTSNPGIFVKHGCFGPGSTTLIHEMGHYIGLVHTFETAYGIEFVDGSNCSTDGDLFCDTPADFLDYRWNCPYLGDDVDPNGDPYLGVINEKLFMSYSDDDCMTMFSNEQKEHMRVVLPTQRSSHLYQSMPSGSSLAVAQPVYPQTEDTLVNPGCATFTWRSVPGATHYNLLLPDVSPLVTYVDVLTTDTFFTVNQLLPNRQYRWKVKALSFGNVCEDFSPLILFKTSSLKVNLNITQPLCVQSFGAISASVSSGIPPYTYEWSTGSTDSFISALSIGDYSLTVTDSAGFQSISEITLTAANAPQLSLLLDNNNTSLQSLVIGGGGSISYFWSTGATSANLQNVVPGTYSLTIATSNGCSATESIVVPEYGTYSPPVTSGMSSINPDETISIYPNPAHQAFNIKMANDHSLKSYELVDFSGRLLLSGSLDGFAPNLIHIPVGLQGFYLVRLYTSEGVYTSKLMIENYGR